MKHAKKFFALLLCAALFAALATPAFAQELPSTFSATVAADKRMVATGENITLTVEGIPPLEAGQSIQYHWWFKYGAVGGPDSGVTAEPILRTQVPGRGEMQLIASSTLSLQFPITYTCQARVTDSSGTIVAYYNGAVDVQGYYNFRDSITVPYKYLGEAIVYMLIPGLVFFEPMIFFTSFACLFGIVWSPWVALANSAEAKRVNG